MPKIVAYKCPFTNNIIENRTKYIRHLRSVRKELREDRNQRRLERNYDTIINRMRHEVNSFDEIGDWWAENQSEMLAAFNAVNDFAQFSKDFSMSIELERMIYLDSCSNSHSAPLGKRTNWGDMKRMFPAAILDMLGGLSFATVASLKVSLLADCSMRCAFAPEAEAAVLVIWNTA